MDESKYIEGLIRLHSGLERQGPGDPGFTDFILEQLPELPANPRIADIGCGAGGGALQLARTYGARVKAVDFSREFLDQMMDRARQEGLEALIEPVECDMGSLDWKPESIDLLWSEGAAYCITFEGALKAWRPLMAKGGVAAISELDYFSDDVPDAAAEYMQRMYPDIKAESGNVALINALGYEVLGTHRLPTEAWWTNYYGPLRKNIAAMKDSDDEVMQAVIRDTEEEMRFFEQFSDVYGYTFFIVRAV